MKSCIIYKTLNKEYKIVTQSKTTAGYLLAVPPVFIVPTNCLDETLLSSVMMALNNSTSGVKAPDRTEFPSIQKQILSELKEKSFSKLYLGSTSCEIRVENNNMTIYPNRLMTEGEPKNGLVWIRDRRSLIEEYPLNQNTIILKIHEALDNTRFTHHHA